MRRGSNVNGVWVEEYDSDAGTYTSRDPDGKVLAQRPLTAEESAQLAQEGNEATLTAGLGSPQVFDALRTIAAGTGQFATAAARDAAIRTCARALVLLIRVQLRRLDATD